MKKKKKKKQVSVLHRRYDRKITYFHLNTSVMYDSKGVISCNKTIHTIVTYTFGYILRYSHRNISKERS